jgi:hypothetical protein
MRNALLASTVVMTAVLFWLRQNPRRLGRKLSALQIIPGWPTNAFCWQP